MSRTDSLAVQEADSEAMIDRLLVIARSVRSLEMAGTA